MILILLMIRILHHGNIRFVEGTTLDEVHINENYQESEKEHAYDMYVTYDFIYPYDFIYNWKFL